MKILRPAVTIVALAALLVATSGSTWVVRSGDTLWGIARSSGTPVERLVAINDITTPDLIRPGETLRLSAAATGSSGAGAEDATDGPDEGEADAGGDTHRVRRGDTVYGIARRYGTSVSALVRINGLTNPHRIHAGRVLTVRSGDATSGLTPPPAAPSPGRLTQTQVGELLDRTARQHGVEPSLVKAVAWQESRWRNHVVSSSGARGIMQIMPGTGQWISTSLAGRTLDLDDPQDNVLAGVLYLRHLGTRTGGDERRLLASYFQGPNAVARHGVSPAGHRYASQVQGRRDRFR